MKTRTAGAAFIAAIVTVWLTVLSGATASTLAATPQHSANTGASKGSSTRVSAPKAPQDSCPVQWSLVSSPNAGNSLNYLRDMVAISANDAWAVGRYTTLTNSSYKTMIQHWDG